MSRRTKASGAKIAVSINMAFEAFLRHSQVTLEKTDNKIDHFSLTYTEYGAKSGAWRLLDLLDVPQLKGSVSTNGLAALRHPNVVRAFADAGHEIVGHAWAKPNPIPNARIRNPQSRSRLVATNRFSKSDRFDLEPVGVLPIWNNFFLSHCHSRSSEFTCNLIYVKTWQGHASILPLHGLIITLNTRTAEHMIC
jgi:hypothetical protein